MAEIVYDSLQYLTDEDTRAGVPRSLAEGAPLEPPVTAVPLAESSPRVRVGKSVYDAQCANCHRLHPTLHEVVSSTALVAAKQNRPGMKLER
jgi:cytochrome c5